MQILNILPFREAVLVAVAIASFITLMLGLVLFKWGKGGRAKVARAEKRQKTVPVVKETNRHAADERLLEELNNLTVKLASTLDRLDTAIGRCVELLDNLPQETPAKGELRIIHSPEPKPEVIKERIERLRTSGLAEEEIAETLSLSREQLKLYMHSGGGSRKEVVLQ